MARATSTGRFPRAVRALENAWIPLSDGARLAARIWLPEDADARPVPAIVEYLPYRKRDGTRARDELLHGAFAAHGYACLRIDLRGSGDSDGLLLDEYLEQELADGVEALRWIAAQRWCTGAVGMIGKSWGGINALQIAARRPPELAAVISVCSTDDRYADDAHYMGGALLNENLVWGSVLFTLGALPPDPDVVGPGWRDAWKARMAALPLHPATWLAHARRDDYWKRGSVCEDYGAIACPVWAVGGWADGYSNAVPRLVAGMRASKRHAGRLHEPDAQVRAPNAQLREPDARPRGRDARLHASDTRASATSPSCTGLVGPWAHAYPHSGVPGPAIDFPAEALRFFDRWLGGSAAPEAREPAYRVWMQSFVEPRAVLERRPGRWVAEDEWPSARSECRAFAFRGGALVPAEHARRADGERSVRHRSDQDVGMAGATWCGFGGAGEGGEDQRDDDRRSLAFDSAPLDEPFEILGAPVAHLSVAADRPLAFLAVRLAEVAADGSSLRVTYGLLNLAHRAPHGHAHPQALVPGERCEVAVRLRDAAHRFGAGSRLRMALSTSYWPLVWPSPEPVTLTFFPGHSRLELPVRAPRAEDAHLAPLPPPPGSAPQPRAEGRSLERDPATGETVYTLRTDADEHGRPRVQREADIELEHGHAITERYRIHPADPLSAKAEVLHSAFLRRGAWSVRVETALRQSSTRTAFRLEADLDAWEGERCVASRRWTRAIPRDHL